MTSWFRHRESHPTQKNIRSSPFKINDDYRTQLPPWRAVTVEYHMSQTCASQKSIPDVNPSLEWENHFHDLLSLLLTCLFAQIKSRYKNKHLIPILFYNIANMTRHDGFAPIVVASSMHNGSQYASTSTPSTVRRTPPHQWPVHCTHCDMPHDDM